MLRIKEDNTVKALNVYGTYLESNKLQLRSAGDRFPGFELLNRIVRSMAKAMRWHKDK